MKKIAHKFSIVLHQQVGYFLLIEKKLRIEKYKFYTYSHTVLFRLSSVPCTFFENVLVVVQVQVRQTSTSSQVLVPLYITPHPQIQTSDCLDLFVGMAMPRAEQQVLCQSNHPLERLDLYYI